MSFFFFFWWHDPKMTRREKGERRPIEVRKEAAPNGD